MKRYFFLVIILLIAVFVVNRFFDPRVITAQVDCGDGICVEPENCNNCSSDCDCSLEDCTACCEREFGSWGDCIKWWGGGWCDSAGGDPTCSYPVCGCAGAGCTCNEWYWCSECAGGICGPVERRQCRECDPMGCDIANQCEFDPECCQDYPDDPRCATPTPTPTPTPTGPPCTPDCTGVECGWDPVCGTEWCGDCPSGETCENGTCVPCIPDCVGKECGDDGCGGSCGDCGYCERCVGDQCVDAHGDYNYRSCTACLTCRQRIADNICPEEIPPDECQRPRDCCYCDWESYDCGEEGCLSTQRYQVWECCSPLCPLDGAFTRCVDDPTCCDCSGWSNDVCGGWTCDDDQMHQTQDCDPPGCDNEDQCAEDICGEWTDVSCGGNDCPDFQMYQTRSCAYHCESEAQCDPRDLGSPTPSVDPSCGGGETVFDFSWTTPAASTCPVSPINYFWQVDGDIWSSPLSGLTTSAGPYSDHGDHNFDVKAKDGSERESLSGTVSFAVDTQGPSAPDPTYSPDCGVITGTEVTFSWDPVTDEGCAGGTIEYAWNVDSGAVGPWSPWQSGRTATWTAETGEHVFYVKARDGVGNEGEIGSISIGVDCTDGPLVIVNVDPCTRSNKPRPRWEWEDEGDVIPLCAAGMQATDTYQVFLDNDPTEGGVNLVDQGFQTERYFQPSADLDDGHYALVVRAFDSCGQASLNEALEDAYVDYTAPVFTEFRCFQSGGEDEGLEMCLDLVCTQNNYVKFEWEATDPGDYPSDLRTENTFYWYTNFSAVGLSGRNGYTNNKFWGPYYISDSQAPSANQFNVVVYDACGNNGNPVPGTIPSLLIDTHGPNSTIIIPEDQFCFREGEEFANFIGTTNDEACAGVVDLDLWVQRQSDNFCWDGSNWVDFCPFLLDTDVNDLDPPIAAGTDLAWSRVNDIPWPEDDSADSKYQVCAVGEDAFGQVEGMTDSCNTFIYDNTLPTCGDTIALFDAETGGWVTTATNEVLVETIGFWDQNCAEATYKVRILQDGVKIWPDGQDWYIVVDTICSTNGGYPNNDYIFESIPTGFTEDGDVLEVCFDVIDCANNRASDNLVEDCPLMETAPGLCRAVVLFDPAWFQTENGNVHANTEATSSILSYIPSESIDPYFSKGTLGNVSAGGEMNFGEGEVSLKGWKVDNYSGSLYQVERKDYDYFWELFGRPTEADAPPLNGGSSDPCNNGTEIAGAKVCYNPGDLTIESKPNPLDFGGKGSVEKKIIFVNGDLQFNRKVVVDDDEQQSVVVFFVKGNLNVSWDLESEDADDPILEGVYVVDGNIYSGRIAANAEEECLYNEETGESDPDTCEYDRNNDPEYSENEWPGKRLVAGGIFITYGGFRLAPPYGRNLKACAEGRLICNKNTPAELFIYRPDLFKNLPDILKEQSLSWGEVAP